MTSSNSAASGDPNSATPNVRWNHRGSPQYHNFTRIGPSSQPTWICGTHDPHDVQLLLGLDRLLDLFHRLGMFLSAKRRDVPTGCKSKISSAFKRTCTMGTCLCRTTGCSTISQKTLLTHFDIVLHRKDRWKGRLVDGTRLRYLHLSAPWDPIAAAQRTRHPADLRAPACARRRERRPPCRSSARANPSTIGCFRWILGTCRCFTKHTSAACRFAVPEIETTCLCTPRDMRTFLSIWLLVVRRLYVPDLVPPETRPRPLLVSTTGNNPILGNKMNDHCTRQRG